MPSNIVTGGTVTVELDLGFGDGFTLDDTQQGVLNNTTYVLDGTDQFQEITVQSISVFRGKRRVTDSIAPGRCVIVAQDPTRAFDPYNTSSVYYNEKDNTPGLSPLRQVRVFRNSTAIFRGRVVDFSYDYVGPKQIPLVTITCADDLFILANSSLSSFTPSEQLSSARISTILDRSEVGWSATARAISTGTTTLGAYAVTEGTNALDYLRQIDYAERGRIFFRASDGVLVSQPRIGTSSGSPVASFADDGTQTPYREVEIAYSTDLVLNRVSVQRTGGTAQVATDSSSIALYFTQAETITNSLLSSDEQALVLANYLIEGAPSPRFSGISTFYGSLTTLQQTTVTSVEIGDLVRVKRTFTTGTPLSVTSDLTVEGIEHRIDLRGETRTLYTAPTFLTYALVLDSTTRGITDRDNVLS